MKVLITGASGLIGQKLGQALIGLGHELVVLTRSTAAFNANPPFRATAFAWGDKYGIPHACLDKVECVIHLAGETVARRWTVRAKETMADSRILSTEQLVKALQTLQVPPIFITASAIGIYGRVPFLAELCNQWENASLPLEAKTRRIILRIGLVLSRHQGLLGKLEPIFAKGLGGRLGNGEHSMSWIHVDDLVAAILFLLKHPTAHGVFDIVSPNPVTNREFTMKFAKALGRSALFPVPRIAVQLLMGEFANSIFDSQKIYPQHLTALGFQFSHPELGPTLTHIFSTPRS